MRSIAARIGYSGSEYMVVNHHYIGIAGEFSAPYLDMPLGQIGIVNQNAAEDDPKAMFLAIAGHCSGYEHQVIRELQDCNAVSAVKCLEMANDRTT